MIHQRYFLVSFGFEEKWHELANSVAGSRFTSLVEFTEFMRSLAESIKKRIYYWINSEDGCENVNSNDSMSWIASSITMVKLSNSSWTLTKTEAQRVKKESYGEIEINLEEAIFLRGFQNLFCEISAITFSKINNWYGLMQRTNHLSRSVFW